MNPTFNPHGTTRDTRQRRQVLRVLLAIPPALLVLASLALLVASPLSWGAAGVLDIPAWMPPAVGLFAACAGLGIGGHTLYSVVVRTRTNYDVVPLQFVLGILLMLAAALFEGALALRIGSPDTYARALEEDGEPLAPLAFIASGIITTAALFLFVFGAAFTYGVGITNQRPNRASERPADEVDGVGELLRGQRRR